MADTRIPITHRGRVVGQALVSETGEIINAELDPEKGYLLAAGIRLGTISSISITSVTIT